MTNNDILKRLRYTFDYNDAKMIAIFGHAALQVDRATIIGWLANEEEAEFVEMEDFLLATFLNGLIIEKRGQKDGKLPEAEKILDNNAILKKLKIALNFKTEDIAEAFSLAGKPIGIHEITAFFRKPTQSQYRPLLDQYLRHFMNGLQAKIRPAK